ncbi:DegT/DnrJ/EryC1/StrS family aminotransferase [Gammaproteobacteria bacterium]|nr:DegT/DnrJ/EryC1/StrS family aminotransferase [Gammaproteobacteria bacterium]
MKVRLSKCSVGQEEANAVSNVLNAEHLGMGSTVQDFELAIKNYLSTKMEVVCVNTATSALQLALSALDIGPDDEVLVPSITYIGGFQAISATGATPIPCEIDPDTLFIDVDDAAKKITRNTKAIMPVHYASASKGMEKIYELAKNYNLRVIEDAAQAFGSKRNNEMIGTEGDIICFSFDGIKNITSGEGGAILTNDKKVYQRLSDDRLLGVKKDSDKRYAGKRSWDFDVENQGYRFHMSNINAAIGIEQLKKLDEFRIKRQQVCKYYIERLSQIQAIKILKLDYDEIVPHIFVTKVTDRNNLRDFLTQNEIECGIHYKPNHLLTKYKTDIKLRITEEVYEQLITFPCHVDLTKAEQDHVIDKILEFYNG